MPSSTSRTIASDALLAERTKRAVALAFAVNGLLLGSLLSRTPAIKAQLDFSATELGFLLVTMSVGAMVALPTSGAVVHREGPGHTVLGAAVAETAGLLVSAAGLTLGSPVITGLGLTVAGFGNSMWDVAMNVEAADVDRRLGRTVMPRFHAGWSLGSVMGAGLGVLCAAEQVTVTWQLIVTAALALAMVIVAVRRFSEVEPSAEVTKTLRSWELVAQAWRDRRTLLVGLMVLTFAFTEGVANDWLAVTLVDSLGETETVGALAFGTFVVAMTLSRLVGGGTIDRFGRVAVLRGTAVIAALGAALVILGPELPWVFAGALLWGFGAALGFPTGMSAAADDHTRAAVHVSVVGSIGYTAFLAGPPLVGVLGDQVGIRNALFLVLPALAVAFAAAPAANPSSEIHSQT
ncbi:MAG: MFS transporter [Nocardioidaceae bacterium]